MIKKLLIIIAIATLLMVLSLFPFVYKYFVFTPQNNWILVKDASSPALNPGEPPMFACAAVMGERYLGLPVSFIKLLSSSGCGPTDIYINLLGLTINMFIYTGVFVIFVKLIHQFWIKNR